MTVTAPCGGRIENFTAQLNESYAVGRDARPHRNHQGRSGAAGFGDSPSAKPGDTDRLPGADANGSRSRVQPTVRGLPVPANAAGASFLSPRLKARMTELGLSAADLAGVAGSGAAGRVTIEDFEKFIAHARKTKNEPGLDDARGRGRCDAAQLDPAHRARRHAGLPRPVVRLSQGGAAQTRPGALCVARAGGGAGGKQRAGRPAGRQQNRPSLGHRHRFCGRSRGWRAGARHSQRGQTVAEGLDRALQRTGGAGARTQIAARRHRRFHRHRHQFRHVRPGMGDADSAAGTDASCWAWARRGTRRVGIR